jgi:hypothetical protein
MLSPAPYLRILRPLGFADKTFTETDEQSGNTNSNGSQDKELHRNIDIITKSRQICA